MINYLGTPTLFFTINPPIVHNSCVSLLCRNDIKLGVFYDRNLLNAREQSILVAMNPKAQAQFVHVLVYAIFIYLFCTKNTF